MAAKYYIYRNLNKGGFSVKHRGKVVAVRDKLLAYGVEFRVSAAGRERSLREGQRNVHAYAACEDFREEFGAAHDDISLGEFTTVPQALTEVWYNPFKAKQFRAGDIDILKADYAVFLGGKCYINPDQIP